MQRDAAIIVAAIKIADITHAELAAKMGVSLSTVSRLVKAHPKVEPENWARAAKALGLEFDWATGHVVESEKIPAGAIERALQEVREPNGGRIIVKLPEELIGHVQAIAERDGLSLGMAALKLIAEGVKLNEMKNGQPGAPSPAPAKLRMAAKPRKGPRDTPKD